MTIMNTKKLLLFGFMLVLLGSCVKYLDPYPNGNKDSENLWDYQSDIQGLIGYSYDAMNSTRNYNDNEGAFLDGATDNAVITNSSNLIRRIAVNTLTPYVDPFLTYWDRDYKAIRNVNLFLKDRRGYNTRFVLVPRYNDLMRRRLQGEAFAIRAWSEWDLLQKFGGKGINGVMLGFPIVTDVIDIKDDLNFSRNTYDECIAQIIDDCDSAYKYLPIAHRDYLFPVSGDRTYAGARFWGRFDGITMRALKSMVYLTWASPRFNTVNNLARWDSAASNAKMVINFKLTRDNIKDGFNASNPIAWTNPNFPGIVFPSRYFSGNDAIERMFYPGGFQGNGEIGATQELVNSFGMANGRPITDPLSGYDANKPYLNREPRFYSAIFYNSAKANRKGDVTKPMYTFENWTNGGKDAGGASQNNSLTNYHIKKFVYMGLNWSDPSIDRQPHSKFFIEWSHMILTFAEAANKVVGPLDATKYGMSARTAIQYLRARKTYDNANGVCPVAPPAVPTAAQDAYLINTANAGAAAFDVLIKNERRIETCFEGMRFYDLRRWTTDADWQTVINKPVHGAKITQNSDLTFTYNLNFEVEPRLFTSPYLPIPYQEILRMSNLIQNEGWENWN